MTSSFSLSLRHALRVARHEWGLVFKEPRFLFPFLVMPFLMLGLQAYTLYIQPLGSRSETLFLARNLLLMVAVLAPGAAVPLGADSFAGEKERNTLEILMCLPVEMGALFWGKVMGILPAAGAGRLDGPGRHGRHAPSKGQWLPGFGAAAFKAMALTPLLGLFLCALSVLFSLISESVRSAAQLTSILMLGIFFSVTTFSAAFYASDAVFLGIASALLAASLACFLAARRRFPRMI